MKLTITFLSSYFSTQWCTQRDFHTSILVWAPKFWCPKRKYSFIYSDIFYCRLCFFLLNLKFVFRKEKILCQNHPKAKKTCRLKEFYPIDNLKHFNMEPWELLQSLHTTLCAHNSMPKKPLYASLLHNQKGK